MIRAITPIIVFKAWANVIRTQYLLPNEKDKDFIMSLFAGAIVNLIINSLLIPKLGAMGAVLGTVAAEGTVCIYQTVVVRKELNFRKYFRDSVTYLLIGGIMYVLVDQIGAKMKESLLTLVTQIGVGACVFICLCVIYIIIDKQNCIHKLYINRFQRREKR
ncbi:polysaccharide biosynthesis C-terminal domain-containing protein [Sellimonas intestinalis]|uniref:polysaccharide biosynthesis C-terminal domain-containing protein n=1 Tax=Sellimonas intestinalis TaxID=1653434 RepID=UPI0039A2EABE